MGKIYASAKGQMAEGVVRIHVARDAHEKPWVIIIAEPGEVNAHRFWDGGAAWAAFSGLLEAFEIGLAGVKFGPLVE